MKNIKYSWNFDPSAEVWNNGEYDTIACCIEAAIEANNDNLREVVYICEIDPFVPWIDVFIDGMRKTLNHMEDEDFETVVAHVQQAYKAGMEHAKLLYDSKELSRRKHPCSCEYYAKEIQATWNTNENIQKREIPWESMGQ